MLFHEAVYTSAPALLEGSSRSDLGIVAKSRGFPAELDRELAATQHYQLLPNISIHDPQCHPPRLIMSRRGAGKEYFCISRIVFAGADHTGRTAPLAHHLVFNIRDMDSAGVSPAALLATTNALFYQNWQRPPTWIDPPRNLTNICSPERSGHFPSVEWEQCLTNGHVATILASAAEQLAAFVHTQKQVVFCTSVSSGFVTYRLMADMLALVPRDTQLHVGCATHVIQSGDSPEDAAIVFTYPGTPFFNRQSSRIDEKAPVLFDLTVTNGFQTKIGGYAKALLSIIQSNQSADKLALAREISEVLKEGSRDEDFPLLWGLYEGMRQVNSAKDLAGLAANVSRVAESLPTITGLLSQWSSEMVKQQLLQLSTAERWEAVAAVAWDARWPQAAKSLALKTIRDNASEALPVFLKRVNPATPAEQSCRTFLKKVLSVQPSLVDRSVSQAIQTGEADAIRCAILLVNAASPRSPQDVIGWITSTMNAPNSTREKLLPSLLNCIYASTNNHTPEWLREVELLVGTQIWNDSSFRRDFVLLLLRRLVSETTRSFWPSFSTELVGIALCEGVSREEIGWLVSQYRQLITTSVLDEWSRRAGMIGRAADLEDDLAEFRLRKMIAAPPIREVPSAPLVQPRSRTPSIHARLNLTVISWVLTVVATIILFVPMVIHHFIPAILGSKGNVPFAYAAIVTGGCVFLCASVEILMRTIRIPITYLRYSRLVRWMVAVSLVAAIGLSLYRMVDIALLSK